MIATLKIVPKKCFFIWGYFWLSQFGKSGQPSSSL